MKNGSCRDDVYRLKIIAVQQRKWLLAVLAPCGCNHEAEHPAQSSDKMCA